MGRAEGWPAKGRLAPPVDRYCDGRGDGAPGPEGRGCIGGRGAASGIGARCTGTPGKALACGPPPLEVPTKTAGGAIGRAAAGRG